MLSAKPNSQWLLQSSIFLVGLLLSESLWAQSDITIADAPLASNPSAYANIPTIQQSERDITALVQAELNRVGCNLGTADGIVGARSRAALRAYLESKNGDYEYSVDLFRDAEFLASISSERTAICEAGAVITPSINTNTNVAGQYRSWPGQYRVFVACSFFWGPTDTEEAELTIASNGSNSFSVNLEGENGSSISATVERTPNSRNSLSGIADFNFVSARGRPRMVNGQLEMRLVQNRGVASGGAPILIWNTLDVCRFNGYPLD